MLANNAVRLNLVLKQLNRFNYQEFVDACVASGVPVLILGDWVSKVGMVCAAEVMFPNVAIENAYTMFVHLRNNALGSSTGVGDDIARITKKTGLAEIAAIYTKLTGKDCGCASRQEALNKLFPYKVKE